jgi:hypothetical protein
MECAGLCVVTGTHARLSPPHKRAFSLFNRKNGARDGNGGGERKRHTRAKNKNCFQFKNEYINYDAKNLKNKSIVQLVNFFISECSASS